MDQGVQDEDRLDVFHDGSWIDLETAGAVSSDTEASRDSERGLAILLGRQGFFDKFHLLLDEPSKEARLRRAA